MIAFALIGRIWDLVWRIAKPLLPVVYVGIVALATYYFYFSGHPITTAQQTLYWVTVLIPVWIWFGNWLDKRNAKKAIKAGQKAAKNNPELVK